MEYYSLNSETPLKVIHIDSKFQEPRLLFQDELTRKVYMSDKVSVLSDCDKDSILYRQCEYNRIRFIKLDFGKIVDQLCEMETEYVLFVRGDALLLNDLRDIKTQFVMAGINYPNAKFSPLNNHNEFKVVGPNKYANHNLIFAKRSALITFFNNLTLFCMKELKIEELSKLKDNMIDPIMALYLSTTDNRYEIDSNGEYINSVDDINYNVVEKDNSKEELARYLELTNYLELECRLF